MNIRVSTKHQALAVPYSPEVARLFPSAPTLPDSNGTRIISHGLRETLLLRHYGFSVPHPIDYYYDWGRSQPFAVQRSTVRMLTENPRAFVLNEMGTGKTKAALWAWDFLNKNGLAKKLLVVAPLSTLRFVWFREAFDTLPHRTVKVLHGSRDDRLRLLAEDADIYVINHSGIGVIGPELAKRSDIDTLVLDELAVYRNNSKRSKDMRVFAQRCDKVWGLTGAPMPVEPTDVWAQIKVVNPGNAPKFKYQAREMLMVKVNQFLWKPKPDAVSRAFSWMQPACRYSLDEVVELPPIISRTIDTPMSAEQEHTYKKVATAMHAMVKDKQINAANAGVAMNKLLQIAGGWVYTENPTFVRLDPTPRIKAMADLIRSASEKVLVAVPYRHMIEGISNIFNMKAVGIDHCVIHGDTKDRDHLFNTFQNSDKYRVMLVHPQCVAHGVTLTAASTIIWYLPVTSLEIYDQFNARITRVGQQHKQQIIHLQGTPIERKVYRALQEHHKLQENFLQMVEEATGEAI